MQWKPANLWAGDNKDEDEEKERQIFNYRFCRSWLLILYEGVYGCKARARSAEMMISVKHQHFQDVMVYSRDCNYRVTPANAEGPCHWVSTSLGQNIELTFSNFTFQCWPLYWRLFLICKTTGVTGGNGLFSVYVVVPCWKPNWNALKHMGMGGGAKTFTASQQGR